MANANSEWIVQVFLGYVRYHKNPKNLDIQKFAVITLKFEQ